MKSSEKGFSLIELAISLTVIGLLVAAVVGGNSLMKQAKIKSFINDILFYENAYNTFKTTYNSPPGDFRKASAVWSTGCAQTPSNCNGTGNGVITYQNNINDETIKAWKHLSLAELVSLSDSVIPDSWNGTYSVGLDLGIVPRATSREGICYLFGGTLTTEGWNQLGWGIGYSISNTGKNALVMGGNNTGGTTTCVAIPNEGTGGALLPSEAFAIDKKIDDGKILSSTALGASTGKFTVDANDAFAIPPTTNRGWACRTGSADRYNTTSTIEGCIGLYTVD